MLQVRNGQIVTATGQPVRLRGTCAGGWMNMESFINGFPGTEQGTRAAVAAVLGRELAQFAFDCWLDSFFAEADVALLAGLGANVLRLPLNYRHFERDGAPFRYLTPGFARLEQAVDWCSRHNVYVILDLHAAPGWQNPDWHSDNPTQHALLWQMRQAQDRFIGLWQEIARRFRGNPTVAGYDLLNEPLTNPLSVVYAGHYQPDWAALNQLYRRAVRAIRAIDPEHIIFLEGDGFATLYDGLEPPEALGGNLAYSSHHYNRAGWGPGPYPGDHRDGRWDRQRLVNELEQHQGFQFARRHGVPLWAGEFGPVFNGPSEDRPSRLRALRDQVDVFEQFGVHWTTWTYKDVGVMGLVHVAPESEYMRRMAGVQAAKQELRADAWMYWLPRTRAQDLLDAVAEHIHATVDDPGRDLGWVRGQLQKAAMAGTASDLLQPVFARQLRGLPESEIERVFRSFALEQCQPNAEALAILKEYCSR